MESSIESGAGAGHFDAAAARTRLLGWYRRRRRDLPWRRTADPYAIWISEIMLQQTRVAAAIPYYERFLQRFPDVATLARARIDSVLAQWSGLGYYRRARFLHAAAKVIARDGFPADAAGWRALPGIGPYTAAAIASIAYGEPVAVVDGNVERVLARLHAIGGAKAEVRALADAWVSRRSPSNHNQAVMELGAMICTPRAPRCDRCPLARHCAGRATPLRYPTPRRRAPLKDVELRVACVRRGDRVLLHRIPPGGALAGMWDLPAAVGQGQRLAVVRHGILDRRLRIEVLDAPAAPGGRFFTAAQIARLPLATAARKCLESVQFPLPDRARPQRPR